MFFEMGNKLTIKMPESLINQTIQETIFGYLYRSVDVCYEKSNENEIIIGDGKAVPFCNDGIISVTEKGVYIGAKDLRMLVAGLFIALDEVEPFNLESEVLLKLKTGEFPVNRSIKNYMLHVCVFPEIPLSSYQKLLKIAGVLGYTHVILEFWGTLQFECLKELSWKDQSFNKAQVKTLIDIIKDFQMQPVPMFNHFGHASGARLKNGKHVVLDQNPKLATLFSNDGWWWRFDKHNVIELLKNIRLELYELFGDGEYFHIGFDESFSYPTDENSTDKLCSYINALCEEIKKENRRPLLWGDLFLHEQTVGINKDGGYEGNCPSKEVAEKMFSNLPKHAIICDWQYFVKKSPWISAEYFNKKGVEFMVCPWLDKIGIETACDTAKQLNAFGLIQTTWHTLFFDGVITPLFDCYYKVFGMNKSLVKIGNVLHAASMVRKTCFADGDYYNAGWAAIDVENRFPV